MMDTQKVAERRQHARLECPIKVRYRLTDVAEIGATVQCRDISLGGVRIQTQIKLAENTLLDMNIHLADGLKKSLQAKGIVMWRDDVKNGLFDTGIAILEITPDDKKYFTNFIFEKLHERVG